MLIASLFPSTCAGRCGTLNTGLWLDALILAFPLVLVIDPVRNLYLLSRAIKDKRSIVLSDFPRFACGSSPMSSARSTRRRLVVDKFLESSRIGGLRETGSSGRGFRTRGTVEGGGGGVMQPTVILRVACDGSRDPNTSRSDSSGLSVD